MKRLELKHLAPYLGYAIKMYQEELNSKVCIPWVLKPDAVISVLENQNKPILRPLSDLVKQIEINGEKFIPAEELIKIGIQKGYIEDPAPSIEIDYRIVKKPFGKVLKVEKVDKWLIYLSFDEPSRAKKWIIDKLYEWHFSIDIPEDLYVDINTL